jgi:hypothetical protein
VARKKKQKRDKVSSKISLLRHEGVPQDQAVATALSMKRAGRLGPSGAYRHVKRKARRSKR